MSLKTVASLFEHLSSVRGIAGVGISGYRAGEIGVKSELVITVYVERYDPEIVSKIPSEVGGFKTVIVPSGRFKMLQAELHRGRFRPLIGGISVGSADVGAGTLGCRVFDAKTGEPLGLSNNHVIAQDFEGSGFRAYRGKPVYQPGLIDGGTEVVGYLERWVPVRLGTANTVDCAVFKPTVGIEGRVLNLVDSVPPSGDAEVGDLLRKSGRTTGVTEARVESVHSTICVEGWGREYTFTDVVITSTALGQAGDSGSLVIDVSKGCSAGLVFAGSELKTAIIPARSIERELGVVFSAPELTIKPLPAVVIGAATLLVCREAKII